MPTITQPISDIPAAIPISVAVLFPETVPGVALYLGNEDTDTYRLYRGPELEITAADLESLRSRGISRLYVASDEYASYQHYLREHLDSMLEDESVSPARRAGCLNEVLRDTLGDIFRRGDLENRLREINDFGRKMVRTLCRDDLVFSELRAFLYHDYHTFTHSANVAVYSVLLARESGIQDREELTAIAVGGLLHDAGKLDIPASILSKPGRLDERETSVMRRHPVLGFRKLSHRPDLSFGQLMMIYQHHEHVDGKGYPVRCTARELHLWGRICAITDVFEALTSSRPYRPALNLPTASRVMQERSGAAFDEDLLKCWIQILTSK